MRFSRLKIPFILLIVLVVISCSGSNGTTEDPAAPFPTSDPTLMPIFDVIITVRPPEGTQPDANIALMMLDEVTGWPHNSRVLPMTMLDDGRWQVSLNPPAGSLLRYRYMRQSPDVNFEAGTDGESIQTRILHISGSTQVEDVIATWTGFPYQGFTGRVIGRLVDGQTGDPLTEMVVNIAGNTIFTDINGNYRVSGIVPGLHTITAFSPDGSYAPAQQGAVVQANSTTPALMGLFPAKIVQVTFEVTVPEDTLEGTQLRIAANLRQFGHIFTELPGGITNALGHMPTLIEVDRTHYVYITNLYAGTDLRYKYTLGDGLINAERDADGAMITREVIIPDEDILILDSIERWQGEDQGSILFWLEVPPITPASDIVSLQLNPLTLSSPIPMWKIGDQQWFYTIFSYPIKEGAIKYRYCRNQQCGIADDSQTSGPDPQWRSFLPSESQIDLRDTVIEWNWLSGTVDTSFLPSLQIENRIGFDVGVEILPLYDPSWESQFDGGLRRISEFGSNSVILTPSWTVGQNNPEPELGFDPAHSPYLDNLRIHIEKAQSLGLEVNLHPTLFFEELGSNEWWASAIRDESWWSVWFERYEAFVLTYAQVAADLDISKIILGGPEFSPSLPVGTLHDGTPSGSILEADSKWRGIISQVRSIFSGRLAIELDLQNGLQIPPTFIDAVDEVHIYWHAPLASTTSASIEDYQAAAKDLFSNSILTAQSIVGKPIYLSLEYPAIDGGTLGCEQRPELNCFGADAFDLGAEGGLFVQRDLQEQAEAIFAVLAESYIQPVIQGFYVRRFYPVVELNDKSASVFGKPAQAVLELWYPQITGQ